MLAQTLLKASGGGEVLAPGDTYECTFTVAVSSEEGATEADVVDATATDDEGNDATGGDGATTEITPSAPAARASARWVCPRWWCRKAAISPTSSART